ncbi:hypothetical protein FOA52_004572, partial [Chlamydomonas sp. UWO 241]
KASNAAITLDAKTSELSHTNRRLQSLQQRAATAGGLPGSYGYTPPPPHGAHSAYGTPAGTPLGVPTTRQLSFVGEGSGGGDGEVAAMRTELSALQAKLGEAEARARGASEAAEAARSDAAAEAARTAAAEGALRDVEAARSEAEAARSAVEAARSEAEAARSEAEAAERARAAAEARAAAAEGAVKEAEAGARSALAASDARATKAEAALAGDRQLAESLRARLEAAAEAHARRAQEILDSKTELADSMREQMATIQARLVEAEAHARSVSLSANGRNGDANGGNSSGGVSGSGGGDAPPSGTCTGGGDPSSEPSPLVRAEAALESERELAESLGQELGLVQDRLAALQKEHSGLKRDHALLSERAAMSEDRIDATRFAAEEDAAAAEAGMLELREEVAQLTARLHDLQGWDHAAGTADSPTTPQNALTTTDAHTPSELSNPGTGFADYGGPSTHESPAFVTHKGKGSMIEAIKIREASAGIGQRITRSITRSMSLEQLSPSGPGVGQDPDTAKLLLKEGGYAALSDRILVLRFRPAGAPPVTAVIAYAPTDAADDAVAKDAFYEQLHRDVLSQTPSNHFLLVLGDFNAKITAASPDAHPSADAAATAAEKAAARKMSAAGSVPSTPAKRVPHAAAAAGGGGGVGGGGGGGALLEAQARESALTQELSSVRAKLEALLKLGAASASDALTQLDTGPGPDTHSLHALLGVLNCSLLLHGSPQGEGDPAASLASVRGLQAQLEHVLQAALSGNDENGASSGDGDPPCIPSLLTELRSLRVLQAECGPGHTSLGPPRPGSLGEASSHAHARGGDDLKAKLAAAAAKAAHEAAQWRAQMEAAEAAGAGNGGGNGNGNGGASAWGGGGDGASGGSGWGGWGEEDGNGNGGDGPPGGGWGSDDWGQGPAGELSLYSNATGNGRAGEWGGGVSGASSRGQPDELMAGLDQWDLPPSLPPPKFD